MSSSVDLDRSHKGWVTRRTKQGDLWANADDEPTSGTTPKITASSLGIGQPDSESLQKRGQESTTTDSIEEPELTAKSSHLPGDLVDVVSRKVGGGAALAANVATTEVIEDDTSDESTILPRTTQADVWSSHPGMVHLPKIVQQLRYTVIEELQGAVAQALPDPRQIFRHMQTISKTSADAIAKILSPYRYASFVEYQATCLDDVTRLSAIVFGHTREEEILKIAAGIQSQNKVNSETMLRAYTAAAVTQWVLRVDFRDHYGARGTVNNGPDIRRQRMEEFVKRGLYMWSEV